MPVFGAHAFIWIGEWVDETGKIAIEAAARSGVELIEIPLLRPDRFDAASTLRHLRDARINASCSLVLPKDAHMPRQPQEAERFLRLALDQVARLECQFLGGVLYGHLGYLTGEPPAPAERETCAEVLGRVAAYAASLGITLGLEPVNRYESYLYNTIGDILTLIDAIGAPNLVVHADTYHMNIEESGFDRPLIQAGTRLGYIHLSESHRGIPGQGNVHWDAVFAGLKTIGYRGPLVLESFASITPDLAAATCMWRTPSYTPAQLVEEGIRFLRDKATDAGLV